MPLTGTAALAAALAPPDAKAHVPASTAPTLATVQGTRAVHG
ncbi:hypothetical protein YT1_0320 [Rhodococcus ruber]|nr:hypothetical protein YT1_0320 [Rhodococcus ruber]